MTRKKKRVFSIPAGIGLGLGVGVLMLLLLLLLASVLTEMGTIPERAMRMVGLVACFLSAGIGAIQCGRVITERKLLSCCAVGIVMFLLTFTVGRGVSEEATVNSVTFASLIAFVLGSVLAGAMCTKKRRKARR